MTDHPAYPGTPRWVRLLGAIALVAVVLFVAAHFAGGLARPRRLSLMTPRLRALLLTAHIATSVGFLGAVSTFFALAIAASPATPPKPFAPPISRCSRRPPLSSYLCVSLLS
jgi:hypothetical protein